MRKKVNFIFILCFICFFSLTALAQGSESLPMGESLPEPALPEVTELTEAEPTDTTPQVNTDLPLDETQLPQAPPTIQETPFNDGYGLAWVDVSGQLASLYQQPYGESLLGEYYSGTQVTILEYTDSQWTKVRIGDSLGYLEGYIEASSLNSNQSNQNDKPWFYIISDGSLNMRSNPSKGASSLALYDSGIEVEVMGVLFDWYHVEIDGQTGFMMAKFLSPLSGESAPVEYFSSFDTEDNSNNDLSYFSNNSVVDESQAIIAPANAEDRVNLRQGPGTDSESLGKYYGGAPVTVLQIRDDGWTQVRIGTLEGYIASNYLLYGADHAAVTKTMPTVQVESSSGKSLNLRTGQSQKTASLGRYESGTQVLVLGITPIWYHVQTPDGQIGFMMAEFLDPVLPQ